MIFEKGDIVQVDYKSTRLIEEWMSGLRQVGPGDVGVVKFATPQTLARFTAANYPNPERIVHEIVTVTFPLLGTFGISSRDLKLLQKVNDV